MNRIIWQWVALAMIIAALLAGVTVHNVVSDQVQNIIDEQVELIQEGIHQRFRTFDEFLKKDEVVLDQHVKIALPKITKELQSKQNPADWTPEELKSLAKKHGVNEIYILDKTTRIISTSFLPDLGFELGTISQDTRNFLMGVFGLDRVIVDRITLSSNTGIINKYAYYSPTGSDYIYELSVEIKPFLSQLRSDRYVKFIFKDLFTDLMGNELLLKSIDLFLVNELVALPFESDIKPIPRASFPAIPIGEIVETGSGHKREYFTRIELDGTLLGGSNEYMAIRSRFDESAADALALKLILSNTVVLMACLLIIYILINYILQRAVIHRVRIVNDDLNRISGGDYESECVVEGSDEIASIARHIDQMRQTLAQRQHELNQAYETLEEKVVERTRDLQKEIEKRVAAEKELNVLATTDPLTKLPNRRLIDHYLKRALLESSRTKLTTAVLFLDLDNFKYVNDSMGHGAGDVLIKTVASRLVGAIRATDTAGRLGGDEFVILLQSLEGDRREIAQHVQTIAEKVLDAVRAAIPIGDHVHHCTMSIGITLSNDYSSAEVMYKQADTAMYRAKELGKDAFCFYEDNMQHLADERLHIEKRLREAIKSQEFFVHYQPQVDSAGRLVGAEALIRWEGEDGKLIPPDIFIPVAEEIGIIPAIGDQVLHHVCAQFRTWLDDGLIIPHISVNISAKQFHQDSFVDTVCLIIGQYDLKPAQIYLEITETAMLGNREEIIQKITQLRKIGFSVSIDDFGTGYSSLNYLKDLPIDQLKIDKSFIHGIGQNKDDSAIVNMIISMAVHLKVDLIAEGVEDKHQFYYLKQNGCYAYQGYFFGKPMAPEAFKQFAEEHNIGTASAL